MITEILFFTDLISECGRTSDSQRKSSSPDLLRTLWATGGFVVRIPLHDAPRVRMLCSLYTHTIHIQQMSHLNNDFTREPRLSFNS